MSSPEQMHISFQHLGADYDINLVKGAKSDHSVKINGFSYAVLGDQERLSTACEILQSVSLESISNAEDLKRRLSTLKIKEAYKELTQDLSQYAKENLKKGALLVQVIGVPGSEKPIIFGNLSATSTEPVDINTVGRTGSGCKLWTALLTKIVTTKYEKYIKMDDKLGKYASQEALKKFGRIDPGGKSIDGSDLAKEITVEGLIEMTAGLEYEDQAPKHDTTETTLDQVMRGKEIKDGSIHILYDPRDKITLYSNYIALTAYPIEKAYKKVLAEENIPNTNKKVGETTAGKTLSIELQELTLGELLNCNEAYKQGAYVYDLIDMFLADEHPPLNNFSYDNILQKELFQPMEMIHSGFYDTPGTAMELTFYNSETKKDESKPLEKEHPMVHGMSYGRTSLSDAAKLTKGLTGKDGLIAETDGHMLLSKKDLNAVFTSHGHNKAWGMGGVELSCGGKIVDKGGWVNQDQYSCWFDLNSGVGMIAMCNCGRRPDTLLAKFKNAVENINYPQEKPIPKDVEGTRLGVPLKDYFDHPLEKGKVEMLFDGTRGRIALLFNYDKDQEGIMHWSGTPLKVKKQKDGTFCVTTPGRYEGVIVQKIQGRHSKINYLAVSDTSFVEINKNRIPSDIDIQYAQNEFENLRGVYTNHEHPEHDPLVFTIEKNENGNMYLLAGEKDRDLVPQSIVKVEKNAISFNGHDRQPPDKIFRFVRKSEKAPWQLEVTDYISVDRIIETRDKD